MSYTCEPAPMLQASRNPQDRQAELGAGQDLSGVFPFQPSQAHELAVVREVPQPTGIDELVPTPARSPVQQIQVDGVDLLYSSSPRASFGV